MEPTASVIHFDYTQTTQCSVKRPLSCSELGTGRINRVEFNVLCVPWSSLLTQTLPALHRAGAGGVLSYCNGS